METGAIAVFMTAGSQDEANSIANSIVESGAAACVQILSQMESVYRWKDKIEREREVLLIAKTTMDRFDDLKRQVLAIHSYETPEIVALPITAASSDYLDWLKRSVGGKPID
jgi:periplasmic divalent cation tolerance protein